MKSYRWTDRDGKSQFFMVDEKDVPALLEKCPDAEPGGINKEADTWRIHVWKHQHGTNVEKYNPASLNAFDVRTPADVCNVLETLLQRHREKRIRIFQGDEEGNVWAEEYGVTGYLGRSTGTTKVPLLIPNARSSGGPAILTHCVLKITCDHRTLYQAKNFKQPTAEVVDGHLEGYPYSVNYNGKEHANCKSLAQAQRLADFLTGKRNNK